MIITKNEKLTAEQVAALGRHGFRRWTKYGKDRMYATAESIGLALDYYKSGNISRSELNGESISHSQARRILGTIDGAYIDIETGTVHGQITACEMIADAVARI